MTQLEVCVATSLSLAKLRFGFSVCSSIFYESSAFAGGYSDALGLEPTILCGVSAI